jgi:choline kinase
MKAVILVAGVGQRLLPITDEIPKCLIKIGDQEIIFHIIDRLGNCRITEVIMVVGYKKELIKAVVGDSYKGMKITYIENDIYEKTNTLYSLWLTKDLVLGSDFLYLHGDTLFNIKILRNLIESGYENAVVVEDELEKLHKDSMHVITKGNRVLDIGKDIHQSLSCGTAVGLYKFGHEGSRILFDKIKKNIEVGNSQTYHSVAIRDMARESKFNFVSTNNLMWAEVDDATDLNYARTIIGKILEEERL